MKEERERREVEERKAQEDRILKMKEETARMETAAEAERKPQAQEDMILKMKEETARMEAAAEAERKAQAQEDKIRKDKEERDRHNKPKPGPIVADDGAIIEVYDAHKKKLTDASKPANFIFGKDGHLKLVSDETKKFNELHRDASKTANVWLDRKG